ncbi:MAG TPA: ABC transporter ATP-binding protein [Acidobacteriota bacterium]|jgi:oligopeptide/dipeptide ABC transporter ATP-binding protein
MPEPQGVQFQPNNAKGDSEVRPATLDLRPATGATGFSPLPAVTEQPILEVRNLCVEIRRSGRALRAVDDVSFQIPEESTLGLVGESGSGKTLTALSILKLPPAGVDISNGSILFRGNDILQMPDRALRRVRGKQIALIFQEPMSALNPVLTVETQLTEGMLAHLNISKKEARARALRLLEQVGISDPAKRLREYPHQLSGGMRQRIMIAMALACEPALIVADEPTTALDVTIQAQILNLIRELRKKFRLSLLLISHDLGVVAQNADWVAVMYAGRIVEFASCIDLFHDAQHPYTQALLRAMPRLEQKTDRLLAVPGNVPSLDSIPPGCSFHPRCPEMIAQCTAAVPDLREVKPRHWARCIRR